MIYTAPYVMLLMRAASIARARLGPGNRDFFGPCEMAVGQVSFGVKKVEKLKTYWNQQETVT